MPLFVLEEATCRIQLYDRLQWIGRKKHAMRIVEHRDSARIAGFIELGMVTVFDRTGEIQLDTPMIGNLVVDQAYRNRGLATAMLLDVEDTARSFGFDKVSANVLNDNKPAFLLYTKKFGFSRYSEVNPSFEDTTGITCMVKQL